MIIHISQSFPLFTCLSYGSSQWSLEQCVEGQIPRKGTECGSTHTTITLEIEREDISIFGTF